MGNWQREREQPRKRLRNVWKAMMRRCTNPDYERWANYGGRGIRVCDRWLAFENFVADMGPTYELDLTIERVDNDGDYTPANCRWVTRAEQALNTRTVRLFEVDGVVMTLTQACRYARIAPSTFEGRLRRGLPVQRALGVAGPAREVAPSRRVWLHMPQRNRRHREVTRT